MIYTYNEETEEQCIVARACDYAEHMMSIGEWTREEAERYIEAAEMRARWEDYYDMLTEA